MPAKLPRLFLNLPFAQGAVLSPEKEQVHYFINVLRLQHNNSVLVFNGRDGEWLAQCKIQGKKSLTLHLLSQTRTQEPIEDVHYLFAPLKHARLDYMAQKATEMGASLLQPVLTRNTQVSRVNIERLQANTIEAAEQCELLSVPDVAAPISLDDCLAGWQCERRLIFCDESAACHSPFTALQELKDTPCAVLVGPEGGFTHEERQLLINSKFTLPISLGPRILRADTAAVAALSMLWLARSAAKLHMTSHGR